MDKLKVGDIKKFLYKEEEIIGVVVGITEGEMQVCTEGGNLRRFLTYKYPLSYTATRLDPKMRDALERVAEAKKNIDKVDEDIKKLETLKAKKGELLTKELENLAKVQGKLTLPLLVEEFNNALKKYHPNLYNKLSNDYRIDSYDSPVGCWIQFNRYDYFDKWAGPSDYDFIKSNYDGTLYISNRTNRYKELCEKYGAKDAKFTVGKLKGEFSNRQELQVGDKGSLCYHNCIGFNFPADCMTKVYIEKLVKSIKS